MKNVAGFLPHFRKTQKIFTTSKQKSDPHKNRLTTCIKDKHTANRQIAEIFFLAMLLHPLVTLNFMTHCIQKAPVSLRHFILRNVVLSEGYRDAKVWYLS